MEAFDHPRQLSPHVVPLLDVDEAKVLHDALYQYACRIANRGPRGDSALDMGEKLPAWLTHQDADA